MLSDSLGAIDYQSFPILYVDDEIENLRTFELAFRRDFSVVRATSGSEALTALTMHPIAVVLSDHRMPGMTGTELLARVRDVAPKTVRLLVTAYGDASTLAQAINEGCIYRYVPKPWDVREMREIVRQAIELYALEEHRQRLVTELSALHEVSRRIAGHLEVGALAEVAAQTVVTDFGFDGAAVFLKPTEGISLTLRSCFPALSDGGVAIDDISLAPQGSLAPLSTGRPVLLDVKSALDAGRDVRSFVSAIAAEEMLFVPLTGRSGLVGALVVDNRRGGRNFGPFEVELLQGLGAQAGIAVENAQLVGKLRNEAARTSGADSLAILGALGASVVREVKEPLSELSAAGSSSATRRAIADVADHVGVFAEIMGEQVPVPCDLRERVAVAARVVGELASTLSVEIGIVEGEFPKLSVLPGRLLQLLLHILELAVEGSAGGTLTISPSSNGAKGLLDFAVAPGDQCQSEVPGFEGEAATLRLAACDGLARELGMAAELSLDRRPATWRLSLLR